MSFIIKLLKFISGCLGSLFLFFMIFILITSLIVSSFISSISNIDSLIKEKGQNFIDSNREEIRSFILTQMSENGNVDLNTMNKSALIQACSNREILVQENPEAANMITPELCSDIDSMSDIDVKNKVADTLIDKYYSAMLDQSINFDELKSNMNEGLAPIKQAINISYLAVLLLLVLGVFFTFGAAGFKLWKGIYKNCLKIGIIFALGLIPCLIILLMTSSQIIPFAQDYLPSDMMNMPANVQSLLLNFIVQTALDIIKSTLLPVFIFSLIVAIVFIVLAIVLKIKVVNKEDKSLKSQSSKK